MTIYTVAAAYLSTGKSTNKVGGLNGATVSTTYEYNSKYNEVASIERHETTLVGSANVTTEENEIADNVESAESTETVSIEKHETTIVREDYVGESGVTGGNNNYLNHIFDYLEHSQGIKVWTDDVVVPQGYTAVDVMSHNNLRLIVEPVVWFIPNNASWDKGKIGFKIEVSATQTQAHKDKVPSKLTCTNNASDHIHTSSCYSAEIPEVHYKGTITYTWKYDKNGIVKSVSTTQTVEEDVTPGFTGTNNSAAETYGKSHKTDILPKDKVVIDRTAFDYVSSVTNGVAGSIESGYTDYYAQTPEKAGPYEDYGGYVYGTVRECIDWMKNNTKWLKSGTKDHKDNE